MEEILDEVRAERAYQLQKWGNDFDDTNTQRDWMRYLVEYTHGYSEHTRCKDFRQRMVKVAALAVAAIEACDRQMPHAFGPGSPEYASSAISVDVSNVVDSADKAVISDIGNLLELLMMLQAEGTDLNSRYDLVDAFAGGDADIAERILDDVVATLVVVIKRLVLAGAALTVKPVGNSGVAISGLK